MDTGSTSSTRPSHLGAINLNDGDLILQLVDKGGQQLIWYRLLRRVGNAGGAAGIGPWRAEASSR